MVIIKSYKRILSKNFTGVICDGVDGYDETIKSFKKNNKYHRFYGPAYISSYSKTWDFDGKCYGSSYNKYNQKQFLKDLKLQWLK